MNIASTPTRRWQGVRAPLIERVWRHVEVREDGCWVWTAATLPGGYGCIRDKGRTLRVHRVMYEVSIGPVPDGLQLDHLCRTRLCVNPAHLEAVTGSVNVRRGTSPAAARAQQTHCFRGHPYDEANTYTNRRGWRSCRTCRRTMERAWRERTAA